MQSGLVRITNSISYLKRYTKFITVGAANAGVDLCILNGLLLLAPTRSRGVLLAYNTVAVVCAIVNSYVWNRRWTFADVASGSRREAWLFALQAVVNVAVNDVTVVVLSGWAYQTELPVVISSNLAKGAAMLLSSTLSYVVMRRLVFRR